MESLIWKPCKRKKHIIIESTLGIKIITFFFLILQSAVIVYLSEENSNLMIDHFFTFLYSLTTLKSLILPWILIWRSYQYIYWFDVFLQNAYSILLIFHWRWKLSRTKLSCWKYIFKKSMFVHIFVFRSSE